MTLTPDGSQINGIINNIYMDDLQSCQKAMICLSATEIVCLLWSIRGQHDLDLMTFYLEQNTKKIFLGNVLNKVLIRIMLGLVNQKLYLVHDK